MTAHSPEAAPAARRPVGAPDATRLVLGGVAMEVCPAPGLPWSLGEEHRTMARAFEATPVVGSVRCAVGRFPGGSRGPQPDPAAPRTVAWRWGAERARLSTLGVELALRRLGAGQYVARGAVEPERGGPSSLCTALACAVVLREGGLVLHATAVELRGRAVLFIGPRGAGKTTAAHQCRNGRWMARDRAAVFETGGAWHVAGLCGGDPIRLPQSAAAALPVAAVLRVRRGDGPATALRELHPAEALVALRESVQRAGDAEDEERVLDAASRLLASVPVAEARTVIGPDLEPPIAALLEERS
ncbi:MAG: hypothetical protein ACFCGT_06980 [Sandaracinaceae bacterium]